MAYEFFDSVLDKDKNQIFTGMPEAVNRWLRTSADSAVRAVWVYSRNTEKTYTVNKYLSF